MKWLYEVLQYNIILKAHFEQAIIQDKLLSYDKKDISKRNMAYKVFYKFN